MSVGDDPGAWRGVQTDLQRAAVQAQSFGRAEINGTDVLVARWSDRLPDFCASKA
jgi:hypothetical protein